MCKYCNGDYLDNKIIMQRRINIGYIGELFLETNLDKDKKSGVGQLSTKVTFLNDGCVKDTMETIKRKIKFCPMCGRKLNQDGD